MPNETALSMLEELVSADLLQRRAGAYRYAPNDELRAVIDELAALNDTRPVSLVRTIQDRPANAVQQFADAFRFCNVEEP